MKNITKDLHEPFTYEGVAFVGAGPGASDLITLRGVRAIAQADIVLYAGSLVPEGILCHAKPDANVMDTATMVLDDIIAICEQAFASKQLVARVHSGDTSLYGAVFEQMERLGACGIPYCIIPGVPAFAATAASLATEFSIPNVVQSVVLTRTSVRSTAMPNDETLTNFAKSGATLAIHLGINNLANIVKELTPILGGDCPIVVAYRVSWPDEQIITGTLDTIRTKVKEKKITRTALILAGKGIRFPSHKPSEQQSALYNPTHTHIFREKDKATPAA